MVHVGLDLSRLRVDVCALDDAGALLTRTTASPDAEGLRVLADRLAPLGEVSAVVESMTGARFVRDELVACGWEVLIADAVKVKGLAPLACKTDKIDAQVLAELSRRDLVPQVWLPGPAVRQVRELSRFRIHLVKHSTMLRSRIHSALITYGIPCRTSDLFGVGGRQQLAQLELPEPWAGNVLSMLSVIDHLGAEISELERQLRKLSSQDPAVPLLMTAPGIGPILGFTIAAEIGDITRFPSPRQLVSYTGLVPRVYQSGNSDRRGPLAKNGPRYLRWALIEAAMHAARHPAYHDHYQRTKTRLGKQRGSKIARVEVARKLTEAIWHMLSTNTSFAPAGAASVLAA